MKARPTSAAGSGGAGARTSDPAGATGSPAAPDPAARPPERGAAGVGRATGRMSRRPAPREQRTTIVYGILSFVLTLVVLQLWLLTATMNAYLGGDDSVIWPAAWASLACLLLNVGLLWQLYRLER